ncbi:MAG: type II toxin-antitoxin system VapC family toxin [Actinobacteria bacterium]|nr:type II toxin-antitoxin system VapC family toxin [Actinomycetota bacterium]
MTYVVDCSIIIRLLASRPSDDLLRQRLARTIHAPALLDAEVSSVVRGLAITGSSKRITAVRAGQMLADYAGLRIVRHPMQPLQSRVFELRHNLTAYDAMYVTLSETLGLPLLTDDGKFGNSPGHNAEIYHYSD